MRSDGVPGPAPRFAVDAMLGRLSRWLRVLGFDCFFDAGVHDHALVQLANAQQRVLLTRDRHLLRELRPVRALEVRQDEPLAQLRAVLAALDWPAPPGLFTRCLVCNGELSAPLEPALVAPLLPPGLHDPPRPLRQCLACGRVYWHGSHVRRMRETLVRALPEWGTGLQPPCTRS